MTQPLPDSIYLVAAVVAGVSGAACDLRTRRIPNLLTLTGTLAGMVLHACLGGWAGLASSLAAGLVCGCVFLVFFVSGGMGGGDVKLMSCVGFLAGWPGVFALLAFTSISGGVMAVSFAMMRGRLRETLGNVALLAGHHCSEGFTPHAELQVRNEHTLRLPYGIAIASGCILTLLLQPGR